MLIFQFQKNSQTTFPNVDIKWIFIFFNTPRLPSPPSLQHSGSVSDPMPGQLLFS